MVILTRLCEDKKAKLIIQTLFASTIRPLVYRTFGLAVRFPCVKVQIKPLKFIELHSIVINNNNNNNKQKQSYARAV